MKRLRALLEKREREREKVVSDCVAETWALLKVYATSFRQSKKTSRSREHRVVPSYLVVRRPSRNVRGIIWNRVNQETKNHRNPLISYKQPRISNMNKNYTFNRRIKFSVRTGGIHRECNWKILPNFYTSNRFPPGFSIDYFLRGLRE